MHRWKTIAFCIPFCVFGLCQIAASQTIHEDYKILANDGEPGERYGLGLAIDDGVIAVGAPFDNEHGNGSGSVYLYDAVSGLQIAKLHASDAAPGDGFGWSIAIDHGVIAIGAKDDRAGFGETGSAYLFDVFTHEEIAHCVAGESGDDDDLGASIDIDGNDVAIGAPRRQDHGWASGAAYMFNADTGLKRGKLRPGDNAGGDHYGTSIAVDNGFVVVGAPLDDDNGDKSGSAYLFHANNGQLITKLEPDDASSNDRFGISVAIDDGVIAVGAYLEDENGGNAGAVYLFDVASGQQLAKLLSSDGSALQSFGRAVAIDDGVVVVGAPTWGLDGENPEAAYLFDAATGRQIARLLPSDGAPDDNFGSVVAIDNGVVVVGADADDDNGLSAGAAYVFTVPSEGICAADINDDGEVGVSDLLALLAAWGACGELCPEDLNNDGHVGVDDMLEMISFWGPCA